MHISSTKHLYVFGCEANVNATSMKTFENNNNTLYRRSTHIRQAVYTDLKRTFDKPKASLSTCHPGFLLWMIILLNPA